MAPKKRKGCKNRWKNKSWTEKQTKLFATVLATTGKRDKPFAYVLETVINEFWFSRKTNLDARDLFNWELSTKRRFLDSLEPNKRQFEINLEAYILRIHLSGSFLFFLLAG